MTINNYSLLDLIAALLAGALAVTSWVRSSRTVRSRFDWLFSILVLCIFVFLTVLFLFDNLIPAGASTLLVKSARSHSLLLFRVNYTVAAIFHAVLLHFALEYTKRWRLRGWRLLGFYACTGIFCGLLGFTNFFEMGEEPITPITSWNAVIPWGPAFGPALLVYIGVLACVLGYIQFLVWNTPLRREVRRTRLVQEQMIRAGVTVVALSWLVLAMESMVGYSGISGSPYVILFGTFVLGKGLALHPMCDQMFAASRA